MLSNNDRTWAHSAAHKASLARALTDRIDFIDQELSWVSSDSVLNSLEVSRRELLADRFRLNIPVRR